MTRDGDGYGTPISGKATSPYKDLSEPLVWGQENSNQPNIGLNLPIIRLNESLNSQSNSMKNPSMGSSDLSSPGPKKNQNEEVLPQKETISIDTGNRGLEEEKNRDSQVKHDSLKLKNKTNNVQECTNNAQECTNSKLQRGYSVVDFDHEKFSKAAGLTFINEEEEEKDGEFQEIAGNNQSIEIVRSYSDGVIQNYSRIHDSSMYWLFPFIHRSNFTHSKDQM